MKLNEQFELYQILDENDYIPSKENAEMLFQSIENESLDSIENLTEGLRKSIKKWNNKRHSKKRMKQMWKDGKAGPQVKAAEKAAEELANKTSLTPEEK